MNVHCHLKKIKLNLIRFDHTALFCYYPREPGIVGYNCAQSPNCLSVGVGKNGFRVEL